MGVSLLGGFWYQANQLMRILGRTCCEVYCQFLLGPDRVVVALRPWTTARTSASSSRAGGHGSHRPRPECPAYGGARRVPGLKREEVAMLAGVSTEYYARLERGNLRGVSESVLESLAARPSSSTRPNVPTCSIWPGPSAPSRAPGARRVPGRSAAERRADPGRDDRHAGVCPQLPHGHRRRQQPLLRALRGHPQLDFLTSWSATGKRPAEPAAATAATMPPERESQDGP